MCKCSQDTNQRVFITRDVRDVHIVGGGGDIFEFLASEDLRVLEMKYVSDRVRKRVELQMAGWAVRTSIATR